MKTTRFKRVYHQIWVDRYINKHWNISTTWSWRTLRFIERIWLFILDIVKPIKSKQRR